ncbi:hypothetical protein HYDPIDRAFT_27253 [Hydnomerulius pinastri MD-312]|nr:hypothetical protein HYDPIDRAFT_27253 [Hydnomerulius pinastri MD-312]
MSLFLPRITTELLHDFFPPSPRERAHFKNQLIAFQDEVTTLQARIAELQRHIKVTKHNLSFARALPLDVLYEIFDRWIARDRDAPIKATHVCRTWRQGILGYPQAWKRIDIHPSRHCQERVAYWMKRAGDCALDVRLHIYGSDGLYKLQRAFSDICNASHCWARLTVFLTHNWSYHTANTGALQGISESLAAISGLPLSLLQSTAIVVSGGDVEDHDLYRDLFLDGNLVFPNSTQKTFACLGARLPLKDSITNNTLHSVTIGRCKYRSATQIIELLSNLPALQVLSLVHVNIEEDEPAIRDTPYIHTSLAEFNVADFGTKDVKHRAAQLLFGRMLLTLPNLRRFQLTSSYQPLWRWDEYEAERVRLMSFLDRSRAPLEVLHIPTFLFEDQRLHEILSLFPRLKVLTVRIQRCSRAPRELLTSFNSTTRDEVLCPDLEHLTLDSCSADHMNLIRNLARNRRQFLEGGGGAENVTADMPMMMRPFRSLHVYGPRSHAVEIGMMMPEGTFRFSNQSMYPTLHEAMEKKLLRPEWDAER